VARRRKSERLNVFLNSRLVGQLNRESSGAIDFRYAPSWLGWENTMPVSLSLPLREDRYIGAPVVTVFDNLLPDNSGIRKKIAERVSAEGVDAFSLLSALGRDCVGALQFLADGQEPGPPGVIKGEPLKDSEIAKILDNLARDPLGMTPDDEFRISIAGAQEKTALLYHNGRWQKPIGTTATTHILKPQIGKLPNGIDLSYSVENEYLCLTLTAALGLPSAKVEMATFGKKRVLVVERFDRLLTRNKRLLRRPQEDCCQALSVPWALKYESNGGPGIQQIMHLLIGSDDPAEDRKIFFKSIIVFWLLGATDGHAKNFSVFLEPGGGFHLTPLYDIVSTQPSLDAKEIRLNKMKLAMAVGTNRHYRIESITTRHFLQTAQKVGLSKDTAIQAIDELVREGPPALERVLAGLPRGFPSGIAESITKGFRTRLQQLDRGRAGAGRGGG
jgi:serine/threonine-protein kinase HipA